MPDEVRRGGPASGDGGGPGSCYSAEHGHRSPDDASADHAEVLRVIYETARAHNPEAVIVDCPCGTTLTPDWMRWQNQAISPDPWTSWVNRGIVKQLKALFGPRSAVVLDHIELSDEGQDFSLIGVGGVPATRITPTGEEKTFGAAARLTFEEKKAHWTRWIGLYRQLMLSRGESPGPSTSWIAASPDGSSSWTTSKKAGQGIGLIMAREILLGHGFDFALESRSRGQTSFAILF
jgi:hypothetical protein